MPEISGFSQVLLYIVGSLAFVMVTLLASKFLRPKNPTEEKQTTYESGEAALKSTIGKFNPRFYIVALVFLLFEAELVFLFPWATVFGDQSLITSSGGLWGWFSFVEVLIFIGILGVGLAYVWAKGMLEWVRPQTKKPEFNGKIPLEVYEKFNRGERHT